MTKILDLTILKVFADDKKFVTQKMKFVFGKEENVTKGENAGYRNFVHFLLFFEAIFLRILKTWGHVVKE